MSDELENLRNIDYTNCQILCISNNELIIKKSLNKDLKANYRII